MKSYLFDTNVWLRFLLNDVSSQAHVVYGYMKEAKSGRARIVVSVMVIWELVFALTKFYRQSRSDVAQKLTKLLRLSYLSIEERDVVLQVLEIYSRSSLSFADIYFACESEHKGYMLFTFDKKLAREAKKFI